MPITVATQRILGLIFFVFGLNGFFHFITPPPMSLAGTQFIGQLIATGYMLPLWKGTEVIAGFLLLANLWPTLALLLISPIVVNILCFHLFLDPGNVFIGAIVTALTLVTAWGRRKVLMPLLKPDT